jgi:serine/threonine protein phosphatase PrpC
MGGHRAGDIASGEAIHSFTQIVKKMNKTVSPREAFTRALQETNDHIYQMSQNEEAYAGMGTTFVGIMVTDRQVCVANVGDSRLYCLRDSGTLEQITEDNSVVQELVKAGEITPEEAKTHPKKHIITRALGSEPSLDVDYYEIPRAGIGRLLLCSDGLTDMLEDAQIEDVLAHTTGVSRAAQQLVEDAKKAGGRDNISVIVIADEGGDIDAE